MISILHVLIKWNYCHSQMIIIFYQDMPIGLMDDIYDFISKFAERLDDLEEVILQQIQQFHLLTFEANVLKSASETLNKYTFQILQYVSWTQNILVCRALLNEIEQHADLEFPRKSVLFPHYPKDLSFHVRCK